MKSKNIAVFFSLLTVITVTACYKNAGNVLPMQEGKWRATQTTTDSVTGNVVMKNLHFIFQSDGTGTVREDTVTHVRNFDWTYDHSSKLIVLNEQGLILVNHIDEIKKKTITWTGISENGYLFSDSAKEVITVLKRE